MAIASLILFSLMISILAIESILEFNRIGVISKNVQAKKQQIQTKEFLPLNITLSPLRRPWAINDLQIFLLNY